MAQILEEPSAPSGLLGAHLKNYFDNATLSPAPDRLVYLTEALEAAFERGDLDCRTRPSSRD